MKAISLWEPWASAIAHGLKRYETRGYPTKYRGPIAIHAARTTMHANYILMPEVREHFARVGINDHTHLAFGKIVAVTRIEAVLPATRVYPEPLEKALGDYSRGRFVWMLGEVRRLKEPIPARGKQGFWEWDDLHIDSPADFVS